jgi:hypothetical protein
MLLIYKPHTICLAADGDRGRPSHPCTAARRVSMTAPGVGDPKIAEPATMTLAPAAAADLTVVEFSPPSTWMSKRGYSSRSFAIFGSIAVKNGCPPNPASTVITKI